MSILGTWITAVIFIGYNLLIIEINGLQCHLVAKSSISGIPGKEFILLHGNTSVCFLYTHCFFMRDNLTLLDVIEVQE